MRNSVNSNVTSRNVEEGRKPRTSWVNRVTGCFTIVPVAAEIRRSKSSNSDQQISSPPMGLARDSRRHSSPSAHNRPALIGRPGSDDTLDVNRPAIHLVLDVDDRRPVEMPSEPVPGSASAHDLLRQEGMDVMDGVELDRGGVPPRPS